jgi:putative membrane protein
MAEILSRDDRVRIGAAVTAAEAATSGEIFVVVAAESDDYRFIPLLWALLVALLVPLPLIFLTDLPASFIYLVQLASFVVLAVVFSLAAVKPHIVPAGTKHARARALAIQQFLAHGLHTTEARTGALVFVSLAERHVEIVADTGIASRVDQQTWDEAVARLVVEVREGRLADGLIAAVERVGAVLAAYFPRRAGDRNELRNEVVVL